MTRTAATARGVRQKKRTPARIAHIEYQPAGLDRSGRCARETYHAVADQAVRVGLITRTPGTALCGSPGPWADIPDALFPPVVTWFARLRLQRSVTGHQTGCKGAVAFGLAETWHQLAFRGAHDTLGCVRVGV